MLGVVLWSDASDRKAVIWCEDQGDLAYLNDRSGALHTGDFFDAGDLVQFDMEMSQSMRFANNPRLVVQKAGERLPQVLRDEMDQKAASDAPGNVIPFSSRPTGGTRLEEAY